MGKKSKIYKSGLPRNQFKKLNNKQIHKVQPKPQSLNNPPTDSFESSQKQKIKLIPLVNYNLDALNKANETLGLSQAEINSLYKRPLRNRRYVNNLTLTKREKKRELRKMKKELKKEMEDKTKLDITLNPNLHFRNKMEEDLNKKEKKNKINKTSIGFNFDEMNGLIDDLVEDNENNLIKENNKNKSSTRNKNQRKLIYTEANEINNMLNNKQFLLDPNATLKMQIQEQQKIKERNEKIREEFNQKYNLLNLK